MGRDVISVIDLLRIFFSHTQIYSMKHILFNSCKKPIVLAIASKHLADPRLKIHKKRYGSELMINIVWF